MSAEVETIQRPFARHLDSLSIPYLWSRTDKRSTIQKGAQDFTVMRNGFVLAIECKDKETPISADQKRWHERMAKAGTPVHVCRSLAECVEVLTGWLTGIGRGAITKPREDEQGFYIFGESVVRKVGNEYEWKRKATGADFALPKIN